jgi:GMP reductase
LQQHAVKTPLGQKTILDILGGLRSTCTYVGASYLKELTKRTTFVRVQEQHNEWFGGE